jgi:hypothetical protein
MGLREREAFKAGLRLNLAFGRYEIVTHAAEKRVERVA